MVEKVLTATVASAVVPVQPAATGIKVNVTVMGALVVLVREPEILLFPLEAIPVTDIVLSRDHVKVVPITLEVAPMVVMALPLQMLCEDGVSVNTGKGLTVPLTAMLTGTAGLEAQ